MNLSAKHGERLAHAGLALLLLGLLPLALGPYWLNLVGKYLAFSFVAVGIVLAWGYCGILSLGQGVFFGFGGYAMAMFLKLEASAPELPDFMVWSSVEQLPFWWEPYSSFGVTLASIFLVPIPVAFIFAYAIFRKRVSGVYFAIVTIALSMTLVVLNIGQQGETGGANGITDFSTLLGFDIINDAGKKAIYWVEVVLLLAATTLAALLLHSRFGKLLIAVRDREDRVRFSGFDTAMIKAFIFTVSAVLSSVGGAMFALQAGLVTPSLIGAVTSVELVIYAAVGGRLSVVGAVVGALLVGFTKSYLSEHYPETWLFFLGAMFIFVVWVLPNGLADLFRKILRVKA